jgi:hypothetical protein
LSIFFAEFQPGRILPVRRFQRQVPASEESCVGFRGGVAGRLVVAGTPRRGQRNENDGDERRHDSVHFHRTKISSIYCLFQACGNALSLLVFIQVLLGNVVFRNFVRPYFAFIWNVFDSLYDFGLESVSFFEQLVHALRIRALAV